MPTNSLEIKTLSDYEKHLIRFENFNDQFILPDLFLVVRIDARRLSGKENSAYPFDAETQNALLATAESLMSCGLETMLAYVHGDEISLVLDKKESSNQRRRSRLLSFVSSYATAKFINSSGQEVVFHAKLSELPSSVHVLEYLIWQRKTAQRNYLFKITKEILSKKKLSAQEINEQTASLTLEQRLEFAKSLGVDFSEIPLSHLYGSLAYWSDQGDFSKQSVLKRTLKIEQNLPDDEQKYLSQITDLVCEYLSIF